MDMTRRGPSPRHGGKSVETASRESPAFSLVRLTSSWCSGGSVRQRAARLHEQLLHQIGGIAAMTAWGPHRWKSTLAGPVGDGPFRHLEQKRDFTRPQQASGKHLGRGIATEQLGDQVLPLLLLRGCVH